MIIKISIDLDSIIIFKFIIFNLNRQIYPFKLRGSIFSFFEREREITVSQILHLLLPIYSEELGHDFPSGILACTIFYHT